jgi:hypothetical protein
MKLKNLCLAVVVGLPGVAGAESLRCEGGMVAEGDSGASVIYKCGQPRIINRYCAPVYYPGTLQVIPEQSVTIPCVLVEEWLYERGPGELVATVYVRSGAVQSIKYGRSPQ